MSEKDNIIEGSGSVYKDIGIPDPTVSLVFCDLRMVAVRGQFYPIEIAVLRVVDDKPRTWSSRIYPALNWSTQVLDASPIDLSTAPAAEDVARQVLDLIDQCSAEWVYSDSSSTSGLLERLLAEAEVGQIYKVDVLRADQIMQDDTDRRAMREQLKAHKRTSEVPAEEVERLWKCFKAARS
ncbi:hypothetical protein [Ruegeria sp. HKCCD7318]|uniref:hypothetical protein n=1 Tax=Ruegeria sp. HKCCD7318 TaxID=2683014 RepID=UPI00149181E5|nr:hypothetical protein [Ruegeria sp. HKCCD7318]NOE35805.1 hypothetical protein [Ruegeria sp. HKCCD7318]